MIRMVMGTMGGEGIDGGNPDFGMSIDDEGVNASDSDFDLSNDDEVIDDSDSDFNVSIGDESTDVSMEDAGDCDSWATGSVPSSTEIKKTEHLNERADTSDSDSSVSMHDDNSWFENDLAASLADSDTESTETWESFKSSDAGTTAAEEDETTGESDDSTKRFRSNRARSVDLPASASGIGCHHKPLRRKIRKAARKMVAALIKHNAYRCPKNKYTRDKMKPLDICSTVHQIYCLFDANDPDVIEKVGSSGNTRDRYSEDPNILERTFILVTQNNISLELDTILVSIVDDLLDYICNDISLPHDFRRLCHTIHHRGGDALGLKRAYYLQLIEIGSQHRYGVAAPAEVFATGEEEQTKRRFQVQRAFETWISSEADDLSSFIGRPIKMVSTWETGQCKDLLSSQVCANNYVASGLPWVNAMPAVYNNTSNPDEIYATSWTDDEIHEGQQRVFHWIVDTIQNNGVLILAKNQRKLFPNNQLAKLLQRWYNFEIKFSINGGRILSLSHQHTKAKVILYSPLGYAMDSRFSANLTSKLRTFLEMGVLKRIVCHLSGKPIPPVVPSKNKPDCITAAYFFESVVNNFHGHERHAAAVARDALTPEVVFACKQNRLKKVSEDHRGHVSTKARSRTWYVPPKRPLEKSIISEGANLLARATRATLESKLQEITDLYSTPGPNGKPPTSQAVGVRLNSLLFRHSKCRKFRKKCQRILKIKIKKNAGNHRKHKNTNVRKNDTIVRDLWGGQKFLIQLTMPKQNTPAERFDPSASKHAIFKEFYCVDPKCFVFQGLRNRINNRAKQRNTNHEKACEMNGFRSLRTDGKVYAFLDESGRPPIVNMSKKASPKGPKGCTVFGICRLARVEK